MSLHITKHCKIIKSIQPKHLDKSSRGLHCSITWLPLCKEDTLSEVQTSSILLRCTIAVQFYDEQQPIYGISAPQKLTVHRLQINPAAHNLIAELHHFHSIFCTHFHHVRALNWMRLLIKWQKLIRTVCCHLHVRTYDILLSQTRGRFISKLWGVFVFTKTAVIWLKIELKTIILWNIITIWNNSFLFKCSNITHVFSVTWSFTNHFNGLIISVEYIVLFILNIFDKYKVQNNIIYLN